MDHDSFQIKDLRLGVVSYDKGRAPIRFGSTIFRYAAVVATVHGDNGAGLGASHQTGWTGLVTKLMQQSGESQPHERKKAAGQR